MKQIRKEEDAKQISALAASCGPLGCLRAAEATGQGEGRRHRGAFISRAPDLLF